MKVKSFKKMVLLGTILLFSCLLFAQITPVLAQEDYYYDVEWLGNNGF